MDTFIQKQFQKITSFKLIERETNHLSENIHRKDSLFEKLTRFYFDYPEKFARLCQEILPLIEKESNPDETILALVGYLYYLQEKFQKAKIYFLKCVNLNPQNLDNWIDLAFTLRHLGENKLANGILFNYDYLIHYYHFFKLSNCSFSELKNLISKIYQESLKKIN